jgi:DNA-binding Xre family transcriptional regulator
MQRMSKLREYRAAHGLTQSDLAADVGVKNAQIERREPIGEIVPVHYEIRVGKDILAHVYEPIACHSYNQIDVEGRKVFIGTIDTLLTFYLAFKYVQLPYYYPERIMCMAKFLFDVQQENRLEQRGILKRFSSDCVGKQATLDDIRIKKSNKFKELANQRGTREYNLWFLKYSPGMPSWDTTRRAAAACPCATKKGGPGSGKVQSPSPSKAAAAAAPATTKKRRRRTAATTQRRALMKLFA